MTADEREALLERTAIMEYDGGLDRKTVTLSAFALYHPAEYQAMLAKNSDAIVYESLEYFLKTGIFRNTVLDSNSISRETRQGIDALLYMTGQGIPLIGVYDSQALIASGEDILAAYTTDPAEILSLMEGRGDKHGRARGVKIRRFSHIPKNAGLLDLDIDRKPGKPDGLKEFYKAFPRNTLPKELQDIPYSFPCWVATPSGGYHLYLKYEGELIKKTDLCPEVEVKHGRPGLTAPGSVNAEGKPYILHGNIADAPPLYWFLLDRIMKPQAPAYTPRSYVKKEWGKSSWNNIRNWTETDGAGAGRNDRAFHLARHARDHGYTESETLEAMRFETELDGLPEKEILSAVKSAFKRRAV